MHDARTFWLTGLSGAGKSTIASALQERLTQAGRHCTLLDGDVLRTGLCADLGFSPESRAENIRRVAHVCKLFNDAGVTAIVALISPYAHDRDKARQIIDASKFLEIHVATSIELCERRDPKGLYAKARAGEIKQFTGISAPYEAPVAPSCRLDTGQLALADCVELLCRL
ncbi:adenylyl-sulfate kinase [Uliginosibacterium sp. H3]|uniref:Adenylyl-sulfate kinase n=1 Tax=Uliginosibacterium silvisoli TaxID=3114758 RepID=A0ABU6K9J0_9RHOO|nr:adenylyl-sulfate kinase [Uliginosibacterium sp. H3]